ncbi:zinc-binding dehydrogenase [Shimia sp. R10_1]|uniref:zinc-binding dehydrogenase n=1 Tax=Shimia sp. R10_1 TaxID=2821095 RepID=UPI001ADA39D5|nr:zinc-binding dehydrogenase [Shimia sp. R10_1]MBO9475286.1 zinc-binding dehydrogenase [Shimia sp. R10_1]
MPQEIVFPAKNTFVLSDYQDAPLAADEIRGPTVATLISQGTELAWASGDDFPIRPGYAAVFRVDEVGADVQGVAVGDLRFCMGHHRSTQQYQARHTLPVPHGMTPETALLARLMGVSMTTLMTTKARPGDSVVICGAGPVGILAAQNFKIGGYNVSVVEPDPLRRAQVEQSGVNSTFAEMPVEDPAFARKVALVVDCSGHEAAVLDACRIVRQGGEVVLVGVPWHQRTDIPAHDILREVFFSYVNLRSGWEWELPIHSRGFVWEELLEGYNNAPHSIFSGFEKALGWLAEKGQDFSALSVSVPVQDIERVYSDISQRVIEEPFIILDWDAT